MSEKEMKTLRERINRKQLHFNQVSDSYWHKNNKSDEINRKGNTPVILGFTPDRSRYYGCHR